MDCQETKENLIAYLENQCTPDDKKNVERHVESCKECKEELQELQETMQLLEVEKENIEPPPYLMNNVKEKLSQKRGKANKWKPSAWVAAVVFSLVFAGTVVAATDLNHHVMDWWKQMTSNEEQVMEENLKHGIGDRLNISEVSNDVKVTITDVVADDIQTLLYYEIEDLSKQANYQISLTEGVELPNQDEIWDQSNSNLEHDFSSSLSSHVTLYSDQENVMKGRLGLAPMDVEEGTIQLSLTKILEVVPMDESVGTESQVTNPTEEKFFEGEWNFEVSIEKHPAIVKDLNMKTEVGNTKVVLEQLTIAPTVTKLTYYFETLDSEHPVDFINFGALKSEGNAFKQDPFLSAGVSSSNHQYSGSVNFESIYFAQPKDIELELNSYNTTINEPEQFSIDVEKESQTFKYLGTEITVDQIEIGNPTTLRVTEELNKGRMYETLDFQVINNADRGSSSQGLGVIIDKHGNEYPVEEYFFRLDELEQPRMFTTEHQVSIESESVDEIIPTHLKIDGYTQTTFLDEVIEINLD
ncbi:DUF4179 domain-containing protein [Ornithinibacillus halophilus]|uniref:Anti-sigma-W factor RsiW n=1 Tax=Ornithinibacillus halophilus TaxID=930117 RepID=A0A1M5NM28_9BACI|nr:DUF4179 domain-containing protein [Ornithinibacillus halophilus]SHG90527.1 Transmembrane transcriptional regulator (anti-sigma factor RsiW) [Ornithinibacillus halophilus]